MPQKSQYDFSESAKQTFVDYIQRRIAQPNFANARSIRNALERIQLRQANRLFARMDTPLNQADLMTIEAEDILASRVFTEENAAGKSYSSSGSEDPNNDVLNYDGEPSEDFKSPLFNPRNLFVR